MYHVENPIKDDSWKIHKLVSSNNRALLFLKDPVFKAFEFRKKIIIAHPELVSEIKEAEKITRRSELLMKDKEAYYLCWSLDSTLELNTIGSYKLYRKLQKADAITTKNANTRTYLARLLKLNGFNYSIDLGRDYGWSLKEAKII